MLQKGVKSDNAASIACDQSPALSGSQVAGGLVSVELDDEVPVSHVDCWGLAGKLGVKVLRQ